METVIMELANALEKEKIVYQDILEISRRKTLFIQEGKTEQLNKMVMVEQSLLMAAGTRRMEREACLEKLKCVLGEDITLTQIMERVNPLLKKRLSAIQQEFNAIIEEQIRCNEINKKLIQVHLDYIDFSLGLMAEKAASSESYEYRGNIKRQKHSMNILDKRA